MASFTVSSSKISDMNYTRMPCFIYRNVAIYVSNRGVLKGLRKNYTIRSSIILTIHKILWGWWHQGG